MSETDDRFDVIGNRFRRKDRISEAMTVQDELRAKSDGWSGEREVKRWRRDRYSS